MRAEIYLPLGALTSGGFESLIVSGYKNRRGKKFKRNHYAYYGRSVERYCIGDRLQL